MATVGCLHQAIGNADLGTRRRILGRLDRIESRLDQPLADTQDGRILLCEILIKEQTRNAGHVVIFDGLQVALRYAEFRRDFRDRPLLALPLFPQNATDGGH